MEKSNIPYGSLIKQQSLDKRGNQRQNALAIGWVINTLTNKMEEYDIEPDDFR